MNADTLAHVDLFATLNKKELEILVEGCQERSYVAGTTLFTQGDAGAGLYVIKSGRVRITRAVNPDRAEEELATAGPGEVFGEMALLDELPRSATVTTIEDVVALQLPVWEFRAVLRDHPDIALKLLGLLSTRLRKAEGRL